MVRCLHKPHKSFIGIRKVWGTDEAPHFSWSHCLASYKILFPVAAVVLCHYLFRRGMAYASFTCMNSYPLLTWNPSWIPAVIGSLPTFLPHTCYPAHTGTVVPSLLVFCFYLFFSPSLFLLLSLLPLLPLFFCVCMCCIVNVCICMFLDVGTYMNGYRDMCMCTYIWRSKFNVGNQLSLFHLIQ